MARKVFLCKWPKPGHEVTLMYAANKDAARQILQQKCQARKVSSVEDILIEELNEDFALEFRLCTPERGGALNDELRNCHLVLTRTTTSQSDSVAPAVSLTLQDAYEHSTYGQSDHKPCVAEPGVGWALQKFVTKSFLPDVHEALEKLRNEQHKSTGHTELRRRVYEAICKYIQDNPRPAQTASTVGSDYNSTSGEGVDSSIGEDGGTSPSTPNVNKAGVRRTAASSPNWNMDHSCSSSTAMNKQVPQEGARIRSGPVQIPPTRLTNSRAAGQSSGPIRLSDSEGLLDNVTGTAGRSGSRMDVNHNKASSSHKAAKQAAPVETPVGDRGTASSSSASAGSGRNAKSGPKVTSAVSDSKGK